MTLESMPSFKHAIVAPAPASRNAIQAQSHFRHDYINSPALISKTTIAAEKAPRQNHTWINGDYDSLPEVPMFFPIERTNTVVNCRDPREISGRIVRSLRKLSIAAKFNPADASLFAETIDHTEFYVRLFKNGDNNNNSILVEIQRARGDSLTYTANAREILASARGKEIDEEKANKRRSSSLTCIPSIITSKMESIKSSHSEELDVPSSVEHVEELIRKDRIDAVQLGLDSLLFLTDRVRSQVSLSASEAVLHGDANGHSTIKTFIINMIHCCPSSGVISSRDESSFDFASRRQEIMHNTALAVLGNSLETALAAHSPTLNSVVQSDEWMGDSGIVNVLLSELSHANERSHDAYHAARCLNTLLETSTDVKRKLVERGLQISMKESQSVGRSRHSLLARECDLALASLEDKE